VILAHLRAQDFRPDVRGRFSAANAGGVLDLNEKSSSIRYLLDEEKVRDTNALGL
jgi:hypothetical protein